MFGTQLNSTIAKVTQFITDLEKGIEENNEAIAKNDSTAADVRAKAKAKALKIKEAARKKATDTVDKAEGKATKNVGTNAELKAQNAVAKKLLTKLK